MAAETERRPALRRLENDLSLREPTSVRAMWLIVAVVVVLGFAGLFRFFWAPAHPGVDQNGYLVGGKMLAERVGGGFQPREPYEFVGWMWIRTDSGWYYPKYPVGLPLLNAIPLWLDPTTGDVYGKVWALQIAPLCMTLALAGMFLLGRIIAGSFLAVLSMILLGTSQTALAVANSPWSHAPALCFVVWGIYLLIRWWQTDSLWRGILAGLLLGYAVTIRYTEGLLVLPVAFVTFSMVRWREPRTYLRAAAPLIAWSVPVILLVTYNWLAMGSITGYDSTNESTGFTWGNFQNKWHFMLQQLYDNGLFFILPLAILGLIAMFRASWRMALLLALWIIPGIVAYTAYYWGLQRAGVGYLRFFLTIFPPMILAGCWFMRGSLFESPSAERRAIAAPLACGVVVAIAAVISVQRALPMLEREHITNLNLSHSIEQIQHNAPRGSVIFTEQSSRGINQLMNFLQFVGDYELYAADAFGTGSFARRRFAGDDDQPNPLQPARRKYLGEIYAGKSQSDLVAEQNRIVREALDRGQRVFVLAPPASVRSFRSKFLKDDSFVIKPLQKWKDPASPPPEPAERPGAGDDGGGGGAPPAPQQRPRRADGDRAAPTRAPREWLMVEIILPEAATNRAATTD